MKSQIITIISFVFIIFSLISCNPNGNPCPHEKFDLMSKEEILKEFNKKETVSAIMTTQEKFEYENRKKNLIPLEVLMKDLPDFEEEVFDLIEEININNLPEDSDLRKDESAVRSQFGGTCTAFAFNAAMESTLCRQQNNCCLDTSERHRWSLYKQPNVSAVMNTAETPIVDEKIWPQSEESSPSQEVLNNNSRYSVKKIVKLGTNLPLILSYLSQGYHLFMWSGVPSQMVNCKKAIFKDEFEDGDGHAYEVSGYFQKNDPIFIIKNSWGINCGDNGHQYMKASTLLPTWWGAYAIIETQNQRKSFN